MSPTNLDVVGEKTTPPTARCEILSTNDQLTDEDHYVSSWILMEFLIG